MLEIVQTKKFKKDFKKYQHDKKVIEELDKVLDFLETEKALPRKYKDHSLAGKYLNARDCHILNDVVLIYRNSSDCVFLESIGSHSELFK
jgi:mRNA interferase YafQ